MIDIDIIYKIILFWVIFYITPGPVWVAVMEATRNLSNTEVLRFFTKVFLPVNATLQFAQAMICVVFVEWVSRIFADIGLWFYIFGGLYILYLSYKVIRSKTKNTTLDLTVSNLVMIMALSPKIWLLFPSGAIIATQLEQSIMLNAFISASIMALVASLFFFLYAIIGKMGTKLLKDNFAYLSFFLLILFALFLFNEAANLLQ